jgi:type II secretory pathway component PulK
MRVISEYGQRHRLAREALSSLNPPLHQVLTPRTLRAQALVPVLFVVLILTALAVTLTGTAKREARSADSYLREVQEYFIAQGAIRYAAAELQQATAGGTTPPLLTPPPDTDANGWTQLGAGWYKAEFIDTTSRVNMNMADAASLAKLPAFQEDPSLAAAVVDWRDADDQPTNLNGALGAESDYYEALNPPYSAKNAPFDTVDELLLVRGMTPEILYGIGAQTPNPLTGGTSAGNLMESATPLSEMLTTYSRERNVASDGTPRVNIKTASLEDLQQKLGLTRQQAQRIVNGRGQNGANLNSIADLLNTVTYGLTRSDMQRIADKITITDAPYRQGVININTAPAEVLATIPGVDQQTYNAIIQARQSGTVFTGMNDLFRLTSLNRQQLQTLVDHVCTKSSTYLVRVRVRMPGSSRVYACEALVEVSGEVQTATSTQTTTSSTTPARILQWREVPHTLGWGRWNTSNPHALSGGTIGTL